MTGVTAVAVLLVAPGVVYALRYVGWLPRPRNEGSVAVASQPAASRIAGPEPDTAAGRPPALNLAWVEAAAPDGTA
jgi:hypothetical protein